MRSNKRKQQKFYSCEKTQVEKTDINGDLTGDYIDTYVVTELYAVISPTAGTPQETNGGIVLDYDRYITVYNNKFNLAEGQELFVDKELEIDENNNILNKPNYVVKKINSSRSNLVTVYGIKRIDND